MLRREKNLVRDQIASLNGIIQSLKDGNELQYTVLLFQDQELSLTLRQQQDKLDSIITKNRKVLIQN